MDPLLDSAGTLRSRFRSALTGGVPGWANGYRASQGQRVRASDFHRTGDEGANRLVHGVSGDAEFPIQRLRRKTARVRYTNMVLRAE